MRVASAKEEEEGAEGIGIAERINIYFILQSDAHLRLR